MFDQINDAIFNLCSSFSGKFQKNSDDCYESAFRFYLQSLTFFITSEQTSSKIFNFYTYPNTFSHSHKIEIFLTRFWSFRNLQVSFVVKSRGKERVCQCGIGYTLQKPQSQGCYPDIQSPPYLVFADVDHALIFQMSLIGDQEAETEEEIKALAKKIVRIFK